MTGISNIKKILKQNGACNDVDRVRNLSELCHLFFTARGAEYASLRRFPDYEMFRKYKDDLKAYGVYVDDNDVDFTRGYEFALIGRSENKAVLEGNKEVYKIYLMHGAKVKIEARGYSVVKIVKLTDDCEYELMKESTVVVL
jgi:hypothetical protein